MKATPELIARLKKAVNRQRLLDTAQKLIAAPSPTGQAGPAADALARVLKKDGFKVERPEAGHPASPAVVVRYDTGRPGRTLQFNGHLDVVHLPYVKPAVAGDALTGSGSCDMKGGISAMVEALRVLRDAEALQAGAVLLTAHDLHEAPWGLSQQLERMIRDGLHGDAVLIPEYLNHCVPLIGRGNAVWKLTIRRPGPPVHEVMRPRDQFDVIAAGADIIAGVKKLDARLARRSHPMAGANSAFIGQVHAGEIFNQFPQECWMEGTMRWLPGTSPEKMRAALEAVVDRAMSRHAPDGARLELQVIRGAFLLGPNGKDVVAAFQKAHQATKGNKLPLGAKPFVDDANSFSSLANVPAITHGPNAGGAHTVNEWVSIDDMRRVAWTYALTAALYCGGKKK